MIELWFLVVRIVTTYICDSSSNSGDIFQVHDRLLEGAQRGGRLVQGERDPGGVEAVVSLQRRVHPPHARGSRWLHHCP